MRGSNWERLVRQGVHLQLAADHINSAVKTDSDFDALRQSSLLTASGHDSNEGKKIRVKIITTVSGCFKECILAILGYCMQQVKQSKSPKGR